MKNLLVMSLFLVASLDADVDLGEEFAAGDLVTADALGIAPAVALEIASDM